MLFLLQPNAVSHVVDCAQYVQDFVRDPKGISQLSDGDLYRMLRAVSEVRQELWNQIASRPTAHQHLTDREQERLDQTHGKRF